MLSYWYFKDWVNRHELWRDFTFRLLSQRRASVIATAAPPAFRFDSMRALP